MNRQSARQYKLLEGGKNIQLVSALLMRLIQASAGYHAPKNKRKLKETSEGSGEDSEGEQADEPKKEPIALDPENNPGVVIEKVKL